jgi:putative oxidoreductase
MMNDHIDARRLVFPGLANLYEAFAPYSYAFMRFCTGAILVPHGYMKLFAGTAVGTSAATAKLGLEPALAWAYAVGGVEFFGGLLLAIGLLTRVAAVAIIVEMVVIVFFVLWPNGYFWTKQGYEFALLWLLLSIGIFFRGGGRYSVDGIVGKEL